MLKKQPVPLLEYDKEKAAVINPSDIPFEKLPGEPRGCVLAFLHEAVKELLDSGKAWHVGEINGTSGNTPIYRIDQDGVPLTLVTCPVGAPIAAAVMEEMHARGITHFISCGGAGALDSSLTAGRLLLPERALRDEGTSYHYQPPERFIDADPDMLLRIENTLRGANAEFIRVTTWTTDAFYRETRDKFHLRREEGCLCVDMECSAFMAVAKHRNISYGAILYAGDNLDTDEWDHRDWLISPSRSLLIELSLRCLAEILGENDN